MGISKRNAIVMGVFMLAIIIVVAVPPSDPSESPSVAPLAPVAPLPEPVEVIEGVFERNGTLSTTLSALDLSQSVVYAVSEAVRPVFDVRKFLPGQSFHIIRNLDGELLAFEYVIDDESTLKVARSDDGFTARREQLPLDVHIDTIVAEVNSSLWGALSGFPKGDQLVMELESVYRSQVDFYRDIRQGDAIRFVIEGLYHRGEFVKYGQVYAAEFVNQGKAMQAYWFEDEYYDETGMSTRRAFLPAPLEFTRISGGFSSARLHPILNVVRAHRGVDYAAPTGTRVMAASDGTVTYAGTNGTYGHFVQIRHPGGEVTEYAHLSRVLVNVGQRVKQEDSIGEVGMTGTATGPHLHYQLMQDGRYVNPRTARLDPPKPIDPSKLSQYLVSIAEPRRELAQLGTEHDALLAEE
jgi:murein DD-endopeptidase MepM/ murein hydrolase activator NlpD